MTAALSDSSGPREADTERNGFLSYAGEWHALTIGLSVGAASAIVGKPEIAAAVVLVAVGFKPAAALLHAGKAVTLAALGQTTGPNALVEDLRREPWYAGGGVVVGYSLALVVLSARWVV